MGWSTAHRCTGPRPFFFCSEGTAQCSVKCVKCTAGGVRSAECTGGALHVVCSATRCAGVEMVRVGLLLRVMDTRIRGVGGWVRGSGAKNILRT